MKQPLRRIKHATGAAAINMTVTDNLPFFVQEIRLTLSAVTTDLDDFEARIDSELGSAFDHLVCAPDGVNEDLSVVTSYRYADIVPVVIFPGDALKITWPNVGTKTWAVEVIGRN